jgi:hypothetical protein
MNKRNKEHNVHLMQSIQAYATGPQVPPGRTTPHSYATAKEKKNEKQIIIY